jgi:hypothetical protein
VALDSSTSRLGPRYIHILYPYLSSYISAIKARRLLCALSSFASRRHPISPRPEAADASRGHEESRHRCLMPAFPSFIRVSRLGVYMELSSSLLLPKPRVITVDDRCAADRSTSGRSAQFSYPGRCSPIVPSYILCYS